MSSKESSTPSKNSSAMDQFPEAKSKTKKTKRQQPKVPKRSSSVPTTAQEHAAVGAVPSNHRRKKRKTTDPPSLAAAEATSSCSGQQLRIWTDADEAALLRAAILFRDERGSLPRPSNILDLFNFVQPSLVAKSLNPQQVCSKLKRLRRKYLDNLRGPAASAGAHDRLVHELAAQLWSSHLETSTEETIGEAVEQQDGEGTAAAAAEEDGGAGHYYPFIWEALADYWREDGYLNATLNEALKRGDPWKAKKLDVKWKQQLERENRLSVKHQHELGRIFQMLA
ncbi:STOREKEEPER protein-like [Phoenix dactylifera]|uniref:STOREKEEPER protein-like n=1 Tax=Phoenix dactylifera TaxID=42345 RepID=A0A8B8ZKC4_PHODC|nr:STOREKEEPER protein-like [Phoenix dactylifera]